MSLGVGVILVMAAALAAGAAHSSDHHVHFGGVDMEQEIMMTESRRQLGPAGYISYAALSRNNIPCNQRGQSYYNCRAHQVANPYTRGCSRITYCARNTR